MPVYDYLCEEGHEFELVHPIAECDIEHYCDCGKIAKRQIRPVMLNCDIAPWDSYISPATGKHITSYKEREADMKASGCVDYDPGMKEVQKKNKKAADDALDKKIGESVEREIEKMPSSKREKLYNEMSSSSLEYTRGSAE